MFNFLCFGFLYNHIQEDSNACSFRGRAGEGEVRQEKEGSHYQLGCWSNMGGAPTEKTKFPTRFQNGAMNLIDI